LFLFVVAMAWLTSTLTQRFEEAGIERSHGGHSILKSHSRERFHKGDPAPSSSDSIPDEETLPPAETENDETVNRPAAAR